MNTNLFRFGLCMALLSSAGFVGADAPDPALQQIVGNWLTEPKDGIIQITVAADGRIEGRIVGGNHPGLKDAQNPQVAHRGVELRGQVILKDMHYGGHGLWSGGTIYKPDNGSTYKCKLELVGKDELKVRGFIGYALFGITQHWTRYNGTSMDLPAAVR